jgi:hypothetical protein
MFLEIPNADLEADITKWYIKPFDIKLMWWNNTKQITTVVVNGLEDLIYQTYLTPSDIQEGIQKLDDHELETFFKDLGE